MHTRGTTRSLALAAGAVTSGSAHTRHGEPAAPFAPRPHASEQRRHTRQATHTRRGTFGMIRCCTHATVHTQLPSHDNLKNPAAQRAVAHKVGTARSLALAANAVTSGSAHPIRNGGDYAAKIRGSNPAGVARPLRPTVVPQVCQRGSSASEETLMISRRR